MKTVTGIVNGLVEDQEDANGIGYIIFSVGNTRFLVARPQPLHDGDRITVSLLKQLPDGPGGIFGGMWCEVVNGATTGPEDPTPDPWKAAS
jgi:hypothetical protein